MNKNFTPLFPNISQMPQHFKKQTHNIPMKARQDCLVATLGMHPSFLHVEKCGLALIQQNLKRGTQQSFQLRAYQS